MAQTRDYAQSEFDHFILTYEDKFPKGVRRLAKGREELLPFYDYSAAH